MEVVNIHSLDVSELSSYLVREELLLEDGDETPELPPQSCFDPHKDFPEIGFVFRVVDARQWRQ